MSSPDSTPSLLNAHDLCKTYRERCVVDHVSMEVHAGEIVGLLGPNGAGKTTSFYMVAGLVRPDEGNVHFCGQDVTGLPMHLRARLGMGYLPQEESIFRKLSVQDNLMAILETRADLSHRQQKEKADELMERFNITRLRKSQALQLSGHNVRETLGIVDRAYILFEGRVIKHGNAQEIANDPKTRKIYLGEHFKM